MRSLLCAAIVLLACASATVPSVSAAGVIQQYFYSHSACAGPNATRVSTGPNSYLYAQSFVSGDACQDPDSLVSSWTYQCDAAGSAFYQTRYTDRGCPDARLAAVQETVMTCTRLSPTLWTAWTCSGSSDAPAFPPPGTQITVDCVDVTSSVPPSAQTVCAAVAGDDSIVCSRTAAYPEQCQKMYSYMSGSHMKTCSDGVEATLYYQDDFCRVFGRAQLQSRNTTKNRACGRTACPADAIPVPSGLPAAGVIRSTYSDSCAINPDSSSTVVLFVPGQCTTDNVWSSNAMLTCNATLAQQLSFAYDSAHPYTCAGTPFVISSSPQPAAPCVPAAGPNNPAVIMSCDIDAAAEAAGVKIPRNAPIIVSSSSGGGSGSISGASGANGGGGGSTGHAGAASTTHASLLVVVSVIVAGALMV